MPIGWWPTRIDMARSGGATGPSAPRVYENRGGWSAWALCAALVLVCTPGARGRALVLGSGGLIGGVLVRQLERAGIGVEQVHNRTHIDLRLPGALDVFNRSGIRYCFFLACEVGGSKFLEDSDRRVQLGILESNLLIYQSVLPWLAAHRVPFVFTSSYLQGTPNSYGVVKRLGEQWVRHMGVGRTFRLWNVYGPEVVGPKSHVLSDWVSGCVSTGAVRSRTNGHEARQFVYVEDVADALVRAMALHPRLPPVTDISSGEWTTMRVVASHLTTAVRATLGLSCEIDFADKPATVRDKLSPKLDGTLHRAWRSRVGLPEGCR